MQFIVRIQLANIMRALLGALVSTSAPDGRISAQSRAQPGVSNLMSPREDEQVVCHSVSETCRITGVSDQSLLMFLLSSDRAKHLRTSGPWNGLFDAGTSRSKSSTTEHDGFSIDRGAKLATVTQCGIMVLKAVHVMAIGRLGPIPLRYRAKRNPGCCHLMATTPILIDMPQVPLVPEGLTVHEDGECLICVGGKRASPSLGFNYGVRQRCLMAKLPSSTGGGVTSAVSAHDAGRSPLLFNQENFGLGKIYGLYQDENVLLG